MEIVIGQVLPNLLDDIAARQKCFQLFRNAVLSIVNERADDRIVAGIFPIAGWFCVWIVLQVSQVIHDIPRTIDIQVPKMISVVPGFDILCVACGTAVFQKLIHFFLGKTKVFIQMRI